jgi:hypothetical protein
VPPKVDTYLHHTARCHIAADHNITQELGTVNPRYSELIEEEITRINEAKDSLKEQKNLEKK